MVDAAFLGVTQSVTGRRWVALPYDERQAQALAQRHNLPDVIARSLSGRCVTLDEAPGFLDPKLRDFLPDPSRFKDMDTAAARMASAIQRQESIAVYGDYDVDGATSTALLTRFARAAGTALRIYVPDRITEGYGPNSAALRQLAAEKVTLTVCVDCGTTAHAPLQAAQEAGMDVIVLDHHAPEAVLPPAIAIVNPNRIDEDGLYGYLAACGVTYLFVIAVNRLLRAAGWYGDHRPEPDLLNLLDLVALGTICDVVRLTGLNRALAAQGLKVMNRRRNAGLVALAQAAGCKPLLDAYAAGFLLGPRVNAGGRVGKSDTGARLLASDDAEMVLELSAHLHSLNAERRAIEAQVLAEAEAITIDAEASIVFVASERWHPGVIGIVAARLKDRFHHPALVIAVQDGVGKGSARSVHGVDLGAHIIAAKQAGLLLNGGGHKMAAGFSVKVGKLDALRDFLNDRVARQRAAEPLIPSLTLDGLAAGTALTPDFARQLARLGPFGSGNPEPRLALADCRPVRADVVGEKHVSVIFMQGETRMRGIAFRALESDLGPALLQKGPRFLHLAGHIRCDEWQGTERVQLQIDDAAIGKG